MYFVCSQGGHYVTAHRAEVLKAGSKCPAITTARCQGRLSPAPLPSPEDRCTRCFRGLVIPSEVGPVCSWCGAQRPQEARERSGAR